MGQMKRLYTERKELRERLATIDKLIYGSNTLALAAQVADAACRADDCKVDMLYGPEIVSRLHDLARLIAGPDANLIYNCDFE